MSEETEQQEYQTTNIPIEWYVPETLQSRYANNVLVQSTPYEVTISFFETQLPPLSGTREENQAKLKQLGHVQAKCVSRIVVTPTLLPRIISALQVGLDTYQEAYGPIQPVG